MEKFIDVGAGLFLYDEYEKRLSAVCDSLAAKPNQFFGPAAWGGRNGPLSGKIVLEAHAVLKGRWEQVDREEWKWFSEEGQEFTEPPTDWPRVIEIKDSEFSSLLSSLSGKIVTTNAELAELLRGATSTVSERALHSVTSDARLVSAQFRHPHIFGEPTILHAKQ